MDYYVILEENNPYEHEAQIHEREGAEGQQKDEGGSAWHQRLSGASRGHVCAWGSGWVSEGWGRCKRAPPLPAYRPPPRGGGDLVWGSWRGRATSGEFKGCLPTPDFYLYANPRVQNAVRCGTKMVWGRRRSFSGSNPNPHQAVDCWSRGPKCD